MGEIDQQRRRVEHFDLDCTDSLYDALGQSLVCYYRAGGQGMSHRHSLRQGLSHQIGHRCRGQLDRLCDLQLADAGLGESGANWPHLALDKSVAGAEFAHDAVDGHGDQVAQAVGDILGQAFAQQGPGHRLDVADIHRSTRRLDIASLVCVQDSPCRQRHLRGQADVLGQGLTQQVLVAGLDLRDRALHLRWVVMGIGPGNQDRVWHDADEPGRAGAHARNGPNRRRHLFDIDSW